MHCIIRHDYAWFTTSQIRCVLTDCWHHIHISYWLIYGGPADFEYTDFGPTLKSRVPENGTVLIDRLQRQKVDRQTLVTTPRHKQIQCLLVPHCGRYDRRGPIIRIEQSVQRGNEWRDQVGVVDLGDQLDLYLPSVQAGHTMSAPIIVRRSCASLSQTSARRPSCASVQSSSSTRGLTASSSVGLINRTPL